MMQKSSLEKLEYWIHLLLDPLAKVSRTLMGARAIYNIPGRNQADSLLNNGSISPVINGINKKVMLSNSYEENLEVSYLINKRPSIQFALFALGCRSIVKNSK